MLLQHLLKEKIVYATVPNTNFKANKEQEEVSRESNEDNGNDLSVIVEEKVDFDDNKVAQIHGTIKGESNKALLISFNGNEMWFPKSVIHSEYSSKKEVDQSFLIDTWILKKNKINYTKT